MFSKIRQTLQDATELLREQAGTIGAGARDKSYQIIEDWMQIFPQLEGYGFEITSFSLSVALSPALEVEMTGKHEDFSEERIAEILKENSRNGALLSVFNTIKTTYNLQKRTHTPIKEPLILKIRIRLSPEIKVYLGEPLIE